jgi:hypothetical protein
VDTPPEENTDQELADLMADPKVEEHSEVSADSAEGSVEVGIPPVLKEENPEVDSTEESFTINDFEEDFHSDSTPTTDEPEIQESSSSNDVSSPVSDSEQEVEVVPQKKSVSKGNGDGDVATFRQSLSNLSRQLEIDRLAFLHKRLEEQGEQLPSLGEIASDISGEKMIKPIGDCDLFSKRPTARLDGWISGFSFGVNKRSKKFSK